MGRSSRGHGRCTCILSEGVVGLCWRVKQYNYDIWLLPNIQAICFLLYAYDSRTRTSRAVMLVHPGWLFPTAGTVCGDSHMGNVILAHRRGRVWVLLADPAQGRASRP